ncbi:hypothetical protein HK101_003828 [Irineochytrium annulatum]|nr:hypothetical protein HK101_003828 [Irineochytrium annulatum]
MHPDFDPAKIPRRRMPKDEQHKVRLMTPFSMRCETCGEYIYKGKKFNARKERVENETYLGIQIFRFYVRCPKCSAEITFKTDPRNSDYVAEHGAQRNFEPWREEKDVDEELKQEKEKEEENNPMKALENRTLDSKREMDILDALDEIRTKNAMSERVGADALLDRILTSKQSKAEAAMRRQEEEDEAVARAMFKSADGDQVRRLMDGELADDSGFGAAGGVNVSLDDGAKPDAFNVVVGKSATQPVKRKAEDLGIVRKRKAVEPEVKKPSPTKALAKGLMMMADYGSDSE